MGRRKSAVPKQPKPAKFHSEAPEEVYELLEDVVSKLHSNLDCSEPLILFKHNGWKSKGKTMFAKIKILGEDLRTTMDKDYILYLNKEYWDKMSDPQKHYILDHQLSTIDVTSDKHGDAKTATDGRPKLKSLPYDIEAYAAVIKRHGPIMEDVKRLALSLKETNQMTIEEVAAGAEEAGDQHEGAGEEDGEQMSLDDVEKSKDGAESGKGEDDLPRIG